MDVVSRPTATPCNPVVLVVDDTDAVREVVSVGLRHQGFEVRAAGNGRDAIELYHELRQQNRDVTVLLDVQMPGMDGPLVLAALLTLDPDVRAYFMTGNSGEYTKHELLAMGGYRVFPKPFPTAVAAVEFRCGGGTLRTISTLSPPPSPPLTADRIACPVVRNSRFAVPEV